MLDQKFWNKYFRTYDVLNLAIPYRELLKEIIKSAEIKKGDLVFDAGSGTGNLSVLIKKEGAKPVSLDFSEAGLEIHKEKDKDATVILRDLSRKLPFEDNYFDKIVSNNVIYAIKKEKREEVFKEFYRTLKPGGIIVISNVHKGFKPLKIFIDHLGISLKKKGFISTIKDLLILGVSVSKMFYYNYLAKKENKTGSYDFVDKEDHKELFKKVGFKVKTDTKLIYSKQAYLDVGVKVK